MHIAKYVHTTLENGVINMSEIKITKEINSVLTEIDIPSNRDLANRERVNFVVNSLIMRKLRAVSKQEDIPMSRIIDNALTEYLKVGTVQRRTNPLMGNREVLLHHLLEIVIYKRIEELTQSSLLVQIKQCFTNYISTSAVLNLESEEATTVGTKVFAFLKDQDNDQFVKFLDGVCCNKENIKIQIRLDGEDIKLD